MFQSFSGSSRRPRQVNLSGQHTNPFAASSWTPAASGTQRTVANAQQERLQRQQERDRLNATKRIQRTWRGHNSRRELADSRRQLWDETNDLGGSVLLSASHLQLFLAFANPRRDDDIRRLVLLSESIKNFTFERFLRAPEIQPKTLQLARLSLESLQSSQPHYPLPILELLLQIVRLQPDVFPHISRKYYGFLSALVTENETCKIEPEIILAAIKNPLVQPTDDGQKDENTTLEAYAGFALHLLTTPNLAARLGGLQELAFVIDVGTLSTALVREFSSANAAYRIPIESRLWLLAHFIALHRLQQTRTQESEYLRALSLQLLSSSGEILGRMNPADPTEDVDTKSETQVLPPAIIDELSSLVNQESISGLLDKFNVGYAKQLLAGEEDASLLASYALTLLRIFPQQGDEIRMWLYRGSMNISSGTQLPALKFFWQAMKSTKIFGDVEGDSKAALSLLRPQARSANETTSVEMSQERDWRTILLFLELYTFVLRFTDDEEFLSGGSVDPNNSQQSMSRFRESALPLKDVQRLTIFLKNLAFTTYFHAGELSGSDSEPFAGGLGSYFGTSPAVGGSSRFTSSTNEDISLRHETSRPFAGVAGMTFEYMRTIVTGVMHMLYERDSRRQFLSKDHWLMTSRFEMEGFIPAVVLEEERQHAVREDQDGDEDLEEPSVGEVDVPTAFGSSRPRRVQALEVLRKHQQDAARKKVLAAVGPRLEVLQHMPFVIPFETRVQIFRQFVLLDQTRRRGGNVDPDIWRMSMVQQSMGVAGHQRTSPRELLGRHHATIRRDNLFEDAYDRFYELGEGLKEPIQITFVDKFEAVEAGIDGGGVTKEFLTSVTNEAFKTADGPSLFVANDQNLLYPSPSAVDEKRYELAQFGLNERSVEWRDQVNELLRKYEFLGRIVGKCLYEGILIDIGFAGFFLLKWASSGGTGADSGYRANINDLRDFDESLYQGLLKLKNYPGDVEDFSLDFTITDTISIPGNPTQTINRDLLSNGSNIAVTNENRPLYISYVARHRLQVQPYQQTQAFLKGLGEIINPSWLSMFNQVELQTLIGGEASEIDVEDLRRNTAYGGIYVIGDDGLEHPTIEVFWRVMKSLDDPDRRKVLKYVTSTPRAPLLGFAQLKPRFSIRDAGTDENRLPSTSTCVNLLKLPRYTSASMLRDKLLYAVNSGAGFDLS
ncbi:E3 ubiquitin-protein ligase (HECT-domain-containing protein) [Phlyctema vagabunda]|uniref:HECT-type E3 ubiquitin transferase n=1 Tax=Phlyctema vagabunda TaxID=108571 RepID=A0ABR4PKB0_9HELO